MGVVLSEVCGESEGKLFPGKIYASGHVTWC